MGNSLTRTTMIWFVGAAVVGAVAGGLHVFRSDIGGAHTGVALTVGAWGLTALAALMLYHGVVVAAGEQDAAAGPEVDVHDEPGHTAYGRGFDDEDTAADEGPEVYTFRRGKPVAGPPRRPTRRD